MYIGHLRRKPLVQTLLRVLWYQPRNWARAPRAGPRLEQSRAENVKNLDRSLLRLCTRFNQCKYPKTSVGLLLGELEIVFVAGICYPGVAFLSSLRTEGRARPG